VDEQEIQKSSLSSNESGFIKSPAVFISSTSEDLKDVRGAVRWWLSKQGFTVLATEEPRAPVLLNSSAFETCFQRIKIANLVILLIDKRKGATYAMVGQDEVSIVRQETRIARKLDKPIITFVRQETLDQRKRFKEEVEASKESHEGESTKELWRHFSSANSYVKDLEVIELIDEINSSETSNWIFPFETANDVLEVVENQLSLYLNVLDPSIPFPASGARGEDRLIFDVARFIGLSVELCTENQDALSAFIRLRRESTLRAKLDFRAVYDSMFDRFTTRYVRLLDGLLEDRKLCIFVTDTTMEYMNPEAWRQSTYHTRILEGFKRLAKSQDLRTAECCRVLILRNPRKWFSNVEWTKSLAQLIAFHQTAGIRLGIIKRSFIAETLDDHFLDFYLIPGRLVALWNSSCANAYQIDAQFNGSVVAEYTDIFEGIMSGCTAGEEGFWIDPKMTPNDAMKWLMRLFPPRGMADLITGLGSGESARGILIEA